MRKLLLALLALMLAAGVGLGGYGVAESQGWFGLSNQPDYGSPTYNRDQTVPSAAATPSGEPAQEGPLAGSHLTLANPQGEAIIDTALDAKYIEMDPATHIVSPGPYPAFFYQQGTSELPIAGQPLGTWVIAGHSGPEDANQKFTPALKLVGMDEASLNQYRATLTAPIGASEWMVDSAQLTGKLAFTGKLAANIKDRLILVLCYVVDGEIDPTQSVFITLIHPPNAM